MARIDLERVRRLAADGLTDRQIAGVLGVSRIGVQKCRASNGIPTKWASIDPERVREMVATGHTDPQIAERLGVNKTSVIRVRHRVGLPAAYDRSNPPESVRASWLRNAVLGSAKASESRKAKRRAFAGQYGLPADLRPTEVKILLALADGPATAGAIKRRYGWRAERNLSAGGDQGGWLSRLIRGGWVVSVYRPTPTGRGRLPNLYTLTLKSLEHLTCEQRADQTEVAVDHAAGSGKGGEPMQAGKPGGHARRRGVRVGGERSGP